MCAFLGERHAVVDWQGLHHLLAQLPRTALVMMKGFETSKSTPTEKMT